MNRLLFTVFLLFSIPAFSQTGLKVGDKAPDFSATDQNGKQTDLKTELKKNKSLVVFFYRGEWCPYCNKHIQQLQDSLQLLTAKGAMVIGVTPETSESLKKTIAKTKASFPMLSDKNNAIMKAYKVDYVMASDMVAKYKTYGIDLNKSNGNETSTLPVPATYIIDKNGTIKFVHFDKDYKKRASVKEMMQYL